VQLEYTEPAKFFGAALERLVRAGVAFKEIEQRKVPDGHFWVLWVQRVVS
jgi:hypothetical protein